MTHISRSGTHTRLFADLTPVSRTFADLTPGSGTFADLTPVPGSPGARKVSGLADFCSSYGGTDGNALWGTGTT